jgi:hypothetical protein
MVKVALITSITWQGIGVAEMVREDYKSAQRDELAKKQGCQAMDYHE